MKFELIKSKNISKVLFSKLLQGLSKQKFLHTLKLENLEKIGITHLIDLSLLRKCKQLKYLSLKGLKLESGSSILKLLEDDGGIASLRILDLSNNKLNPNWIYLIL